MEPAPDFIFAQPQWLLLLVLVPLIMLLRGRQGSRRGLRFSSLHLVLPAARKARLRHGLLRWLLLAPAFALAAAAMARPQWLTHTTEREFSGVEIMLAIDVSRSMTAEDFFLDGNRVDRIRVARILAREFIAARPNDRIGAVAFAGRPYQVSVPVINQQWVKRNINRIEIGLVEDGTAIGSAIAAATNRLARSDATSRIIVLFTDGKNNSGHLDPIDAARNAAALGIRIYTIGIGGEGEALIRVPDQFGRERLARLMDEFDPESLAEIARITGGRFYVAQETETLREALRDIDELEKSELITRTHTSARELFPWLLWPAALLLVLEIFLPGREEKAVPA